MDEKEKQEKLNNEPEIIEIDDSIATQMDIFTKGFVNPLINTLNMENKQNIKLEEPIVNVSEEKQAIETPAIQEQSEIKLQSKALKTNEEQMNENVSNLISELSEQDNEREIRQAKKRKLKNTLLIIGILLEVIVIGGICYVKFIKENYASKMTCSNTIRNDKEKYSIETENTYYFDKENNVAKTENAITYLFDTVEDYNAYKKDYADATIDNYKGIKQKNIFDDKNKTYKTKTSYTYSLLMKNKNVKVEDKLITATIPERVEPITLYIQTLDEVVSQNEQIGFICE